MSKAATVAMCCLALTAAACGAWFDNDEFLPTSPSVAGALTLTPAATSIPANGFSTVLISASISPDATAERRTVVFETTAGTFAGTGTPEQTSIERTVDGSGTATAELRSSRTLESARVTASVKGVTGLSREVLVSFTGAASDAIIRVSSSSGSAPADGETITTITAEVAPDLPAARRTVTFRTTLGRFAGDVGDDDDQGVTSIEVAADGSNRATAFLRSPSSRVGTAFVTASVDATPAVSATTAVLFTRAAPTQVLVTASQPTAAANFTSIISVRATLVRDPGVATEGTIVTFRAEDANGDERGVFAEVTRSNSSGTATADFAAGPFAAPGPMRIFATAEGVTGSTVVQVVP
jgi:hypothetical protein